MAFIRLKLSIYQPSINQIFIMKLRLLLCTAALGTMLVSCFDDNYNLSDIDTTTEVAVKDLVIPVNMDAVYLSDVIKLDDDSDIKTDRFEEGPDGMWYYIDREGDFSSDPIFIKSPYFTAPSLQSKTATLVAIDGTFPIPPLGNDFTLKCDDIDESLVDLTKLTVSGIDFSITLNTIGLNEGHYSNLNLQLPKGLSGTTNTGSYDASTGVWTMPELPIVNGVAKAVFSAKSIDLTALDFTYANPHFELSTTFGVIGGSLTVSNSAGQLVDLSIDFSLTNFNVTSFDGTIKYKISGMEVESISLSSLPDFLQGDETNITLVNPLICLQTNNPIAGDKLRFSAALTLTAQRDEMPDNVFTSNAFSIGYGSANGLYNTILSPEQPQYIPGRFDGYTWCAFPGLGSLIAGNGIPRSIGVRIDNPEIPEQQVKDFELGRNLDGVTGVYELFAPLALQAGSTIVYSDTKDGWNKDIADLTVTTLTLTANATNNTPLSAQLTVYPIDTEGKRIEGVTITSNELASGKADSELTFTLNGELRNLDGVEFVARVVVADNKPLSSGQSIVLKNIRAKVSGNYKKEL